MKQKIFILLSLCFVISCKKEYAEKSIYAELSPFTEVQVNSGFQIFIEEDSSFSIRIVGDESVIDDVSYRVENNRLLLFNNRKLKWLSPEKNQIKIYIRSYHLTLVEAAEGCNIQTVNPITSDEFGLVLKGKMNEVSLELNNRSFYYWNNFPCGGKLSLSGNTEVLRIYNFAIMSVDAKNLNTAYALIENNSKGDCETRVSGTLEYSISGTGNIHLYGSPVEIIPKNLTSSGQLIRH